MYSFAKRMKTYYSVFLAGYPRMSPELERQHCRIAQRWRLPNRTLEAYLLHWTMRHLEVRHMPEAQAIQPHRSQMYR